MSGSVAAADGALLRATRSIPIPMRSAQGLAPTMAQVLESVQWQPSDVQLIAVTQGPGSFTGLRVGVTTAKVFSYATGSRLVGVDTLEVIVRAAPAIGKRIWAVIDALRDQLFVASFTHVSPGKIARLSESELIDRREWLPRLNDDLVIGPGLAKLQPDLPSFVEIADQSTWEPSAIGVAQIAWQAHLAGAYMDPWSVVPAYFRPSYAEEPKPGRRAGSP